MHIYIQEKWVECSDLEYRGLNTGLIQGKGMYRVSFGFCKRYIGACRELWALGLGYVNSERFRITTFCNLPRVQQGQGY